VASQLLDRIPPPWMANPRDPAIPGTCHTDETVEGIGEKILNELLYCILDGELSNQSGVQGYHVPCEPALMGLTAGLTSKFTNRLTAKLTNCLTAKFTNCLTAKLVDRLTTKLVVVDLVKLHLTKSQNLSQR